MKHQNLIFSVLIGTLLILGVFTSCTNAENASTGKSSSTGSNNSSSLSLVNIASDSIRVPAVAGQFYPGDPVELSSAVEKYLANATPSRTAATTSRLVGLIVPHAGYQFSGPTAATAFKSLMHQTFDRVYLLGVDHHSGLPTMSIWPRGAFNTPLGLVPVDASLSQKLLHDDEEAFTTDPAAHAAEHSLEVLLPFYLKTLGPLPAVFVSLGGALENGLLLGKHLLSEISGQPGRTLIIASSDWSHYHDAASAEGLDGRGLKIVQARDPEGLADACRRGQTELCGINGVLALLTVMKAADAQVTLLERSDSSKGTGDRDRVVGYAAVLFEAASPPPLSDISPRQSLSTPALISPSLASTSPVTSSDTNGHAFASSVSTATSGVSPASSSSTEVVPVELHQEALSVIRKTLESVLSGGKIPPVTFKHARFSEKCGVFVTLKKGGQLRGCIGLIEGVRPLGEGIQEMAVAAATEDPRFPTVTVGELKEIRIEVSILSPMIPVKEFSEIQVGRDGVLLRARGGSGVFLPQVATEQGWDRDTFLENLCYKAGLPAGSHTQSGAKLYRFTAEVFGEEGH
ncbi:MAG: AmmeMemoRadiSam system protein B [Candidatus Ozemobacteraceae bacterium]